MSIHIQTNIVVAVNAIDANEVEPVVDVGNEFIYWLDTSNKELGNLRYTEFNKLTGVATRSWSVRYGTASTVQQVMFGRAQRRWKYDQPLMTTFPNYDGHPDSNGSIIPGCYC
jgi:hypothetical protein